MESKEHGDGIMLIQTFVLTVINNEWKNIKHHKIIDRISEETASVIIQVSKAWGFIRTYGGHVSHLFIHLNSLINIL